jgi:hypothetical protein
MKDPSTGKHSLGKQGFAILFAVLTGIATFAFSGLVGPARLFAVATGDTVFIPAWYQALAGVLFGVLMAEAVIDYREFQHWLRRLVPTIVLLLLGSLGGIRWAGRFTPSGHAVVAAYFLLHQLTARRSGRSWKLVLGAAILAVTALYKLFVMQDPATLLLGVGTGLFAWGLVQVFSTFVALRARAFHKLHDR